MNSLSLVLEFKNDMKSKTTVIKFSQIITIATLFFSALKMQAQQCVGNKVLIYIDNVTATSNALEYDVFVKNIGTTSLKMSGFGGNVLYGDNFLPTGAIGTLSVVEQPNQMVHFSSLNNITPNHSNFSKQLRWAQTPTNRANAVDLPSNVALKFARFRFESSIDWDINAETDLTFPTTSTPGITLNVLVVFCEQNTAAAAAISIANNNLVLQSETATTPSVHVNMFRLLNNMAFESHNWAAYPNPFEQTFKLSDIQLSGAVNVEVFDATGRKVEQRSIEASEVSKQEFGQTYPSGFYMISVSQGNQKQTFKLVKK